MSGGGGVRGEQKHRRKVLPFQAPARLCVLTLASAFVPLCMCVSVSVFACTMRVCELKHVHRPTFPYANGALICLASLDACL